MIILIETPQFVITSNDTSGGHVKERARGMKKLFTISLEQLECDRNEWVERRVACNETRIERAKTRLEQSVQISLINMRMVRRLQGGRAKLQDKDQVYFYSLTVAFGCKQDDSANENEGTRGEFCNSECKKYREINLYSRLLSFCDIRTLI